MLPIDLQPFDHLIYCGNSIFDIAVRIKTWSPASHIEVYAGSGKSWASRNGKGVSIYDTRLTELVAVLRPPVGSFDVEAAREWFYRIANGQKYDWKGLLCFMLAVKQGSPKHMFCSEFAKRLGVAARFHSIQLNWDADKTAPGSFLMSPAFVWTWYDKTKF